LIWDFRAPPWAIAKDGLGILGVFQNQSCRAKGEMVYCSLGYESFDLIRDQPKCPMCSKPFKAIKPGFSNCRWRLIAVKKTENLFLDAGKCWILLPLMLLTNLRQKWNHIWLLSLYVFHLLKTKEEDFNFFIKIVSFLSSFFEICVKYSLSRV
jgi:hypothetical protein